MGTFKTCDPKTLIMRAKRAYDVTTAMTSSNPTRVKTRKIRKSSCHFAFCYYLITLSVLCLHHSYTILNKKRYLIDTWCDPSMHSSPQVPRCFFQSEPPPLPVSFFSSKLRTLREDTRDQLLCNCWAIIINRLTSADVG